MYYALRLIEDVGILVKKCMVVEGVVENMDVVLVMNVVENVDVIVGVKRPKWVFDLLSGVVEKMDVVVDVRPKWM